MLYALFIVFGIIPSFAWLLFFLKEDVHPEPKKMIAKVFAYGALITIVATALQYLSRDAFDFFKISSFAFLPFLSFAAIEEILKFITAYGVVYKSKYFDEPIDAMIYMIVVALGFALVENLAIILTVKDFPEAIGVIVLRFVGATLLHALSSGIVGYYWAKSIIYRNKRGLFWIILEGLVIASVLHAIFNWLIIVLQDAVIFPTIFLIVIALIVFWDFDKIKSNREYTN